VVSSPVQAVDASPRRIVTESPSRKLGGRESSEPRVGSLFAGTLLVLVLLAAALVMLRRWMRTSRRFAGHNGLRILGRRSVAPRQEIIAVDLGPRVVLVGVSKDRLVTLAEIAAADEIEELRARFGARPVHPENLTVCPD